MPYLFLLRHATAGWAGPGLGDFDRPLTEKGRSEATAIGNAMLKRGYVPDLVLCSSSERTRATWSCVAGALQMPDGKGTHQIVTDAIYDGDAANIVGMIRDAPPAQAVLIVGHNPAMAELAALLPGRGEAAAMRAAASGFPKAALAVMASAEPLAHLRPGSLVLEAFLRPDAL